MNWNYLRGMVPLEWFVALKHLWQLALNSRPFGSVKHGPDSTTVLFVVIFYLIFLLLNRFFVAVGGLPAGWQIIWWSKASSDQSSNYSFLRFKSKCFFTKKYYFRKSWENLSKRLDWIQSERCQKFQDIKLLPSHQRMLSHRIIISWYLDWFTNKVWCWSIILKSLKVWNQEKKQLPIII